MADQPNVYWDDLAKTFVTGQVGAANSGTAITGGGSSDQAWQFRPETFGAKGDGKILGDVACTASSAIITSASNPWTSADVGKAIQLNGAIGSNNIPLLTTILSFQSAGQVTLAANATNTLTAVSTVYATDDTAAINLAITAAKNYAVANNYYCELLLKDKIYGVSAAPTQTNASPAVANAQILIPWPPSNVNRKLTFAIIGAGAVDHFQYWQSTVPTVVGSAIVSFQTAPGTLDGTFGVQSVIGAPSGDAGFAGSFVNTKVIFRNFSIWCPVYTNMTGTDLTWVTGCEFEGFSTHIFAQAVLGSGVTLNAIFADAAVFGAKIGVGARLPAIGNNADVYLPNFATEGYTIGLMASEHVRIGNLKTIYNAVPLKIDTGQGLNNQAHGVIIQGWTAEAYQGAILCVGTGICHVDIRMITEGTAATYDISDTNNTLRGVVHWFDPVDAVGTRFPIVTGGTGLRVVNETRPPGHVASPAVPATTVNQQNTFWRDAAVNVSGGTVTAITVDGTATGLTTGTVIVPSGKNINITYSVAPAWNWTLL